MEKRFSWPSDRTSETSLYGDRIELEGETSSIGLPDPQRSHLEEQFKKILDLRAQVLSRFITIESEIDELIKLCLFSFDSFTNEQSVEFDLLFLKSGRFDVGKKIDVLNEILNYRVLLKKFILPEDIELLKKSMHARNRFAHGRIVFLKNEAGIFYPVLRFGQDGVQEHKLDELYFEKIFDYYKSCLDTLTSTYLAYIEQSSHESRD